MRRTFPIFLAFILMAMADAMGPLSSVVSGNPFMASLMPFSVFIAFALFSVPAGLLGTKIGKKKTMVLGLGINTVAVAIPAFLNPPYPLLLGAIFLLGIGTTLLQVAGNPIMRDISAPGDYSRNLALAQGIKGIGVTGFSYLVTSLGSFALFAAMSWRAAFPIFFALTLLGLVSMSSLRVDEVTHGEPPSLAGSLSLLREPIFALSVLGIFLYVGAEVGTGTFLRPMMLARGFTEKDAAFFGPSVFFGSLTLGRLVGGCLRIPPHRFLRISVALGLAGFLMILTKVRMLTVPGVVLGGLGCANIWPMLFSITVEKRPERASELSGLMCMSISGSALIPLLMGRLGGITFPALSIPVICFTYLMVFSMKEPRRHQA